MRLILLCSFPVPLNNYTTMAYFIEYFSYNQQNKIQKYRIPANIFVKSVKESKNQIYVTSVLY